MDFELNFLFVALIIILIVAIFHLRICIKALYLYFYNKEEYEKYHNKLFPKLLKANYEYGTIVLCYSDGSNYSFVKLENKYYKLPMMETCDSYKQDQLDKIDKYITQWHGEYPNAHLNQKNNDNS